MQQTTLEQVLLVRAVFDVDALDEVKAFCERERLLFRGATLNQHGWSAQLQGTVRRAMNGVDIVEGLCALDGVREVEGKWFIPNGRKNPGKVRA
jgi:hypothetical protein